MLLISETYDANILARGSGFKHMASIFDGILVKLPPEAGSIIAFGNFPEPH